MTITEAQRLSFFFLAFEKWGGFNHFRVQFIDIVFFGEGVLKVRINKVQNKAYDCRNVERLVTPKSTFTLARRIVCAKFV